ncbi:uncharacterized protein TNCT_266761 [Trichonephila clavata]|uniref:Uncharacterized protein n=1 Tax=Trichonephila clavata TaxID=2740835 RepID=A0A8X6HRZ6_TRICU|nr:uncharacterized protein TNCT_266761 [Trichonephila clavata]
MLSIFVFLAVFAFVTPYRGDSNNVEEYVDKVLSEYLPGYVKKANLDINELQDFYFNVQNTLSESEAFDGTVTFHLGNLTGLNAVHRRFCQRVLRSPGSLKIVCNVVLPRVGVTYRGRYEAITGFTNSNRDRVLQQRNFYSEILLNDVEAQIELTKLNDNEQLSVTNLLLLGEGEVTKVFQYNDATQNRLSNRFYVPYHEISGPFYQKCANLLQQVFYGSYRRVLEEVFSTIEYPERY